MRPGTRPVHQLDDPAAVAVEDRLYAALAALRVIVTVNLVGLTLWRRDNFDRPEAAWVAVALLVLWTAWALWAYRVAARRTAVLLLGDLVVAAGAMALTPWLKGEDFRATLPGFWVMGALLAWAIHWHWRGGLVAGLVLSVVDVLIRPELTQTNYGHIFLLLLGGAIVGYMCESLQVMAADRARAEREAAAAAERTRLARAVHDGVLQVLSLVQRRGAEAQGEFAELGRLAGEQEAVLRALIRAQDNVTPEPPEPGEQDLAAALEQLASASVTVVTTGAVPLPRDVVAELVAATRACLDNVRMHVGADAPAWVMLDRTGPEVTVSVRDEGLGIPDHRLEEAARDGRLGVVSSIRGRVHDLGGTATLHTGEDGTEWELSVPVEPGERP